MPNEAMTSKFNSRGEQMVKKSVDGNKQFMRERCRSIIESMDGKYTASASVSIYDKLIALPEYDAASMIFCYINLESEPATDRFIARALSDGKKICVPLTIDDSHMIAKAYTPGDELVPGIWGLMEPVGSAETVDPGDINLAIVPCIAADRNCMRIGHGAGYYDRYLEGATYPKVALCFDRLIMGSVPSYKTDVRMDAVVTESEVYRTDDSVVKVRHSGAR